jgi:HAD superfamily hydrolase (TIGR01459 family)
MMQTQFMPHLSEIHEAFDAFIIDLWGVLHNGKTAFPDAVEALSQLKAKGKPVILLSNAPRRLAPARHKLAELGIPTHLYQNIYTSGEDCYRHLKHRHDPWYAALGERLFHIGPERDRNLFEDLPFQETTDLATADFILNTGTLSWDSKLEDFTTILEQALGYELPMICPNPDKVVMFGHQRALCAGAIAEKYQQLNGFVRYHGKPFASIYQAVMDLLPSIPPQRILAIGDSLGTDIKGAKSCHIPALMVMSGIHQHHFTPDHPPLESLAPLAKHYQIEPTFLSPCLKW